LPVYASFAASENLSKPKMKLKKPKDTRRIPTITEMHIRDQLTNGTYHLTAYVESFQPCENRQSRRARQRGGSPSGR
jgi:hypothetical protein